MTVGNREEAMTTPEIIREDYGDLTRMRVVWFCPNCDNPIRRADEFQPPCVCGDGCHDERGFWCVSCVDALDECQPRGR